MVDMRPKFDASVVAVRRGSEVLLVRRRDVPVWVLPGGGIDPGESPEQAAIREAKEETGLQVKTTRKVAEYLPWGRFARLTHFFEAEVEGGEISCSEESSAVEWHSIETLPKELLSIHRIWIEESLTHQELIRRPQKEVTLWRLAEVFFQHPLSSIRYFIGRIFRG